MPLLLQVPPEVPLQEPAPPLVPVLRSTRRGPVSDRFRALSPRTQLRPQKRTRRQRRAITRCCYMDTPYEKEGGRVPDERRTQFFKSVLAELARAIRDGAKVRAFHAWSLMDNFEWTDGYSQRYGLTYVDYRDQKRTVKDSGLWYGRVAASGRLGA